MSLSINSNAVSATTQVNLGDDPVDPAGMLAELKDRLTQIVYFTSGYMVNIGAQMDYTVYLIDLQQAIGGFTGSEGLSSILYRINASTDPTLQAFVKANKALFTSVYNDLFVPVSGKPGDKPTMGEAALPSQSYEDFANFLNDHPSLVSSLNSDCYDLSQQAFPHTKK